MKPWPLYYTDRWPARQGKAAVCLRGEHRGRFVVITILVRGSNWICHPSTEGDEWSRRPRRLGHRGPAIRFRVRTGRLHDSTPAGRPPRWIRKAAKMALRHVMEAR